MPKAPPCPHCKGAKFVRKDVPLDHPDFGRAIPCVCSQKELKKLQERSIYEASNLGGLRRLTFQAFEPAGFGLDETRQQNLSRAFSDALRYAAQPDGWLILMGGYGCGKTHLAAAIANEQIKQGHRPLFIVVPDLLDHLRSTYAPSSAVRYDEMFDQVRNAELLILDDLGTQNATPWAQEKLFQIINHRYNAQLPTVVTTNQELEDLDMRIRSRMADPSSTQLVRILAPDFRQSGVDHGNSDVSALPLLHHMSFDSFELRATELSTRDRERLRQAYNAARSFADDPDGWLILTGSYGVGKTHLAAAIANRAVRNGKQALLVVVPDLLDILRSSFAPTSSMPYDKRFDQVRRSELLVLDDLGTQSATPWAVEKLFQLFNYRYNAQLPTVITLNDIDAVDPRLLQRMMDMQSGGRGAPLDLDIPPYDGGSKGRSRLHRR